MGCQLWTFVLFWNPVVLKLPFKVLGSWRSALILLEKQYQDGKAVPETMLLFQLMCLPISNPVPWVVILNLRNFFSVLSHYTILAGRVYHRRNITRFLGFNETGENEKKRIESESIQLVRHLPCMCLTWV